MSFTAQIGNFRTRSIGECKRIRDGVAIELFGAVITDTPVDTGRLRGAWVTTHGEPSAEQPELFDREGAATLDAAKEAVANAPFKDTVYFANNLPYARPIEYGHSAQKAPHGMVRRNVVRFQSLLDKKARERR